MKGKVPGNKEIVPYRYKPSRSSNKWGTRKSFLESYVCSLKRLTRSHRVPISLYIVCMIGTSIITDAFVIGYHERQVELFTDKTHYQVRYQQIN